LLSINSDISSKYFLDDVRGAKIPASRLRNILGRIDAHCPLTVHQQQFLRENGYEALLQFALGELELDVFCAKAQDERDKRRIVSVAAKDKAFEEKARFTDNANRKNAAIFAERERRQKHRKKLRELPDRFDLPFVKREDLKRIGHILQTVIDGNAIEKVDLVWLGTGRNQYLTDQLSKAHHKNMATKLSADWKQTGDVWKAVNACGHWRKAKEPREGLKVAEFALSMVTHVKKKARSALLTTGGGAHRDLRQLPAAIQFGMEAHILTPEDFRPCTLLGAVHIQKGTHVTGLKWYEKAEARGASRQSIDRELQLIVNAASPEERKSIIKALKTHDSSRFRWLSSPQLY
jgi:hypothetical protein